MKIVIAKTAGFCMGVRRAVDMVLDASRLFQKPIYTYGPLIHNSQALKMLEEKNIQSITDVDQKSSGIVLIRAHGVPFEKEKALKKANFKVIDATCPRVKSVQNIIRKYSDKNYSIIIVGDDNHPEVIGLKGYAKADVHTISSLKELEALALFEKAVVVAQTTQNLEVYEKIKKWCELNTSHYKVFDTICHSTKKRQKEVQSLAENNDAIVVVGGEKSGNTKRLFQIAYSNCKIVIHIEEAQQLDCKKLSLANSIAITAGASTPNWIIADVHKKIQNYFQKKNSIKAFVFFVRDFLLKTNIMAAAGAGSLTYAVCVFQKTSQNIYHAMIAMTYVLSMQILNNLFAIRSDKYNRPERAQFYKKNQIYLWFFVVLSGVFGLYLSSLMSLLSFFVLLLISLLGLSYNLKIIPEMISDLFSKGKIKKIKDIPGSKTILITLAWGVVTSLLPALSNQTSLMLFLISFVFACGLVFARTIFFDILAVQGDRITGKETLPIIFGEKISFQIIKYVLISIFCVILFVVTKDIVIVKTILPVFIPLIMLFIIWFYKKARFSSEVEFIIESLFIVTGFLCAL